MSLLEIVINNFCLLLLISLIIIVAFLENRQISSSNLGPRPKLTLRMFEIQNEKVRDLQGLASATHTLLSSNLDDLPLSETPLDGIIVKVCFDFFSGVGGFCPFFLAG